MYKNFHFRTGEHTKPGSLFSIQDTRVKVRDICTLTHSLTTHLASARLAKTETQTTYTLSVRASHQTGEKTISKEEESQCKATCVTDKGYTVRMVSLRAEKHVSGHNERSSRKGSLRKGIVGAPALVKQSI